MPTLVSTTRYRLCTCSAFCAASYASSKADDPCPTAVGSNDLEAGVSIRCNRNGSFDALQDCGAESTVPLVWLPKDGPACSSCFPNWFLAHSTSSLAPPS